MNAPLTDQDSTGETITPSSSDTDTNTDAKPGPDTADGDDSVWEETSTGELPDVAGAVHELREDLAAATAEWRRGTRRNMEVMKEFGGALNAMGAMLRDVHSSARQPAAAAAGPGLTEGWLSTLIDLSDRLTRTAAAFTRTPPHTGSWWPGARAALAAWESAWTTQHEAFAILQSHLTSLLARAGLQRLQCEGTAFDPTAMTAVEVVADATVPDHTVTAELLSGWRHTASQKIIRPAQVRVSRRPA